VLVTFQRGIGFSAGTPPIVSIDDQHSFNCGAEK